MNTVPRYAAPIDRALLLTPSATLFEVSIGGVPTPDAITFSALMLGATGEITFSSEPPVPLTVANGNAVLRYADMSASVVTVTATTVIDGLTYYARQTVAKRQALDLAPPPAPTGLVATGTPASIVLRWDTAPANYSNLSHTEVWRASVNNFSQAALVGRADGREYTDPVGPGATRYYWIRYVSRAAIPGPYNTSSGTVGASDIEVEHLLDVLMGEITESQLHADLGQKIDLIDDLADMYGDTASAAASAAAAQLAAAAADRAAGGASQYASQASQSATNAGTAASAASTSAGQSSRSATSASGSAADADSSASTAATAAGAAGASASAASTSKDQASAARDAAGVQAAASSRSAIEATAARDAASGSAGAALQSVGAASAAASDAGNSATAARAERVAAEAAYDQAAGAATSANSSAQEADARATAAEQSAAAANNSATTAGTAAGQAGSYLQQVAESATQADGSARAAASFLQQAQAILLDPVTGLVDKYAAVKVLVDATASSLGLVQAKYIVQVDADGVSGGLELVGGGGRLDFGVRASAFFIAAPAGSGIAAAVPFIVRTTETVIDGQVIPIGMYVANAFIQNAAITNAKIGGDIWSMNFVAGVSGWRLYRNGDMEINNLRARGRMVGGAFVDANWPEDGSTGFYLGPDALRMGNFYSGKYAEIGADGNIYTPQFTSVNGRARFGGELAGVLGTFQLMRSPTRSGPAGNAGSGAGYDLTGAGLYFYDGVNALPCVELGDYIT